MDNLFNSGDIVNSRYRILHQLGHREFGRTYLAEEINRFNQYCVLKEFAPQLQSSFALSKGEELFKQEAEILYGLQHPQIPKFRELFRYQQENKGRLLLVREYIEGKTYHALLNDRAREGKRFSEAEIIQLLCQILPVLEYIHSMGIIHRSISADNIILRGVDKLPMLIVPMLIRLGSIKEVEQKAQSQLIKTNTTTEISLIGTEIGKSGYSPPEQINRGIVFAHSDLYALAATAVVLLTGKEPEQSSSNRWNWQEEVTLNPKLEWVLTTMLSPNPDERLVSATEVIKALDCISVITPSSESVESAMVVDQSLNRLPPEAKIRIFPRSPSKSVFFGSLTLAALLGGFWGLNILSYTVLNSHSSVRLDSQFRERFSQGEKVLISQTTTPEKELAVAAFAQGNYDEAESLFSASLKTLANDPEALIYLNNARIGREQSYRIAVSVPIGSQVNVAQEILRGVAQAQAEINQQGGIRQKLLLVQIVNDDNNSEIVPQLAKQLATDKSILAVVGHNKSNVSLAASEIYQKHGLVMISPTSGSTELSNIGSYIFRTVFSIASLANTLSDYASVNSLSKIAICFDSSSSASSSFTQEFIAEITKDSGIIAEVKCDFVGEDLNPQLVVEQALTQNADALLLAPSLQKISQAIAIAQLNQQRLPLLGTHSLYTYETIQKGKDKVAGMVLPSPWLPDTTPNSNFLQTARKYWGGKVNWRTAMAYDATAAIIQGLQQSDTRSELQSVLTQPDFLVDGATGKIHFEQGDRVGKVQLVCIQPSDRDSSEYQFSQLRDCS